MPRLGIGLHDRWRWLRPWPSRISPAGPIEPREALFANGSAARYVYPAWDAVGRYGTGVGTAIVV